jgi:hypothetical protein
MLQNTDYQSNTNKLFNTKHELVHHLVVDYLILSAKDLPSTGTVSLRFSDCTASEIMNKKATLFATLNVGRSTT